MESGHRVSRENTPKLIQPCIPVYGLASLLDEQKQAHYFGKRKGRVETSQ